MKFPMVERQNMVSCPKSPDRIGKVNRKSDAMLLAVLNETLEQVFKGVGVQVIYVYFEQNFQLKREDIMKNPEVFSAGLEKLLGSAAGVIEKLIIRNLCQRIGLNNVETEGFQFSDRINELRWEMSLTEGKALDDSRKEEIRTESSPDNTVSARGIGMSKQVLDKLWRPLFPTKAKGMGFGLPIYKRVVEAHGGKICAESIVGKGATFRVAVPVEPKLRGVRKFGRTCQNPYR